MSALALGVCLILLLLRPICGQVKTQVKTNQRLWHFVSTISTDSPQKLNKSILPQARYCQIMKQIQGNELYRSLSLYTGRNPLQKEQVCRGDVEFIVPRFRTAKQSNTGNGNGRVDRTPQNIRTPNPRTSPTTSSSTPLNGPTINTRGSPATDPNRSSTYNSRSVPTPDNSSPPKSTENAGNFPMPMPFPWSNFPTLNSFNNFPGLNSLPDPSFHPPPDNGFNFGNTGPWG